MTPLRITPSVRRGYAAVALVSVLLLGCARKVQIEVPAGFHGHVQIVCNGLTDDRTTSVHVESSGIAHATNCPSRQIDTVVTRANDHTPIATNVMWTTTGDGLVRQIAFDVQ